MVRLQVLKETLDHEDDVNKGASQLLTQQEVTERLSVSRLFQLSASTQTGSGEMSNRKTSYRLHPAVRN